MGVLADATLAAGGRVIGVIPQALVELEVAHRGLTELHVVDTMHQRKAMMFELADAFVVAPGGLGTLEEAFETLTGIQLGYHNKPIVFLDVDGFWPPLEAFLDHAVERGRARAPRCARCFAPRRRRPPPSMRWLRGNLARMAHARRRRDARAGSRSCAGAVDRRVDRPAPGVVVAATRTSTGTLIKAKDVDVGLLGATGCNTGGDRTCVPVTVKGTFVTTGYVAAGTSGLLAVVSVLLAIAAAARSERRKLLAKLAVFAAVIAGIVAIALIVQGPDIEAKAGDRLLAITVPLGIGTYLFAIGMMSAIGASVFALRPAPAPRRRPAKQPGPAPRPAAVPPSQPVDMFALLQEDALRPTALGPEPMMGRSTPVPPMHPMHAMHAMQPPQPTHPPHAMQPPQPPQPMHPMHAMQPPMSMPMPPGPGGALPGPAGPLGIPGGPGGPPLGEQPLFSSAPQLRPLYDASPHLGGTGGFVPSQQMPRQMRPPTPIPRDQISARAGIPTPPPFEIPQLDGAPVRRTQPPSRPPMLPSAVMPIATPPPPPEPPAEVAPPPHNRTKTLPPPIRGKSLSAPPPISAQRPVATLSSATARMAASKQPTIGAAVVPPPPGGPFVPTVPFPAANARPAARPGPRAETDPLDRAETVDPSAETSSHERQEDSALARFETTGVVGPLVIGESASFESATAEVQSFASRASTTSAEDLADTHSLDRMHPTDLDLPVTKPPPEPAPDADDAEAAAAAEAEAEAEAEAAARAAAAAKAAAAKAASPASRASSPVIEPPPPAKPEPPAPKNRLARGLRAFGIKPTEQDGTGKFKLSAAAAKEAKDQDAAEAAAKPGEARPVTGKVPISTAPSSLPPPSEKQSTTSGPSPACPQCEAPMAWVEEHLRFYCKSCKMYF